MKKAVKPKKAAKAPLAKKKTETTECYELWNLPEYGYVMISHADAEKKKVLGTMLGCGRLSRKLNVIYLNGMEFARLKGRMPKVVFDLRTDAPKDKLDLSLRDILVREELL